MSSVRPQHPLGRSISKNLARKIVWSNNGCIAYISADGRNVILRHLFCDHQNGQWVMSKENVLEDALKTHSGSSLAHLSWSHSGTELAVIDVYGRISIYAVLAMPPVNRLTTVRRFVADPEDNLSSVVGMMWLHNDKIVGVL